MSLELKSLHFIETVAKNSKQPLYAGNSGGKDSAVMEHLLQKSGIEYFSQYANTTMDPPGTIKHIRTNYPHTKIIHPEESFYQLVERKGLPTRLTRFCCEVLKENVSIGKMNFEGVRSAESTSRQNRDYIQCDTRKSMQRAQHIYPIYDWRDKDIWEYIRKNKIELAPAYSNGLHRLGCVGCPLITRKGQRAKEFRLYPRYYEAIKRAIQKGMNNNPQWKISCATNQNADKAMQWWLSGKTIEEYFPYSFEKTEVRWEKKIKYVQFALNLH